VERKAMVDLLKRFEEDSLDNPFANGDDDEGGGGTGSEDDDDDDDDDDLERRLAGIDLGEFIDCLGVRPSILTKDSGRKCLCGSNMGCADSGRAHALHSRRARPGL
jgi:hypothetical protein